MLSLAFGRALLLRLLVLLLAAGWGAAAADPAVRVLILSGRNNHDWRNTTPYLRNLLLQTGRFDVRVTEEAAGLTAKALSTYDVVVSDYCGPRLGGEAEAALEQFVKQGKGLVVVHAASYPFGKMEILGDYMTRTGKFEEPWPVWGELVGATWDSAEPRTGHAPRHTFEVKLVDRDHPVTSGLPASYRQTDELYHSFRLREGNHVLATAHDSAANRGTGKDEPLIWTRTYGQGRMFHTALGHEVEGMMEPGFIMPFVRGVEWAATGKVTLPGTLSYMPSSKDLSVHPSKPGALRLLVVTGGHTFEPSFFRLIDDRADWITTVNGDPKRFPGNLVKQFDVVLFYDMTPDPLSDRDRAQIEAFLEAGKGVVVMHHALASFQSWPFWYEQVVGAKYVLKAEPGGPPASTYKHDVDLWVTAPKPHPVTKGVAPLHILDETYGKMWFAPGLQVLLEAKNEPTTDGPVAWIGPHQKAKVVVIQLGHGRDAHLHPAMQRLVRNAVMWSGGRLK